VVLSSFPLAVGTLAPSSSATANATIDFTGCGSTTRFSVTIALSANAGTRRSTAPEVWRSRRREDRRPVVLGFSPAIS